MMTSPDTVRVWSTLRVETLLPVPMVRDLQKELAERSGWKAPVKLALPMMTSTVAAGTPAVQLPAFRQSLLTVPVQEVVTAWALNSRRNSDKKVRLVNFFMRLSGY